jgi:hypothetical protein
VLCLAEKTAKKESMENRQFSSMRKPDEKDVADVATIASMSDPLTLKRLRFPSSMRADASRPTGHCGCPINVNVATNKRNGREHACCG